MGDRVQAGTMALPAETAVPKQVAQNRAGLVINMQVLRANPNQQGTRLNPNTSRR